MKKLVLSVAMLAFGTFAVVSAQTTPSITDLLKDASFGYDAQNYVAVDSIDAEAIHLRSPIIKYYDGDLIYTYRLTYSPYLINQELVTTTDPALLDQIKSKEVRLTSGADRVTLDLGIEEGITTTKTYYAVVTPVDIYDEVGTSSEQICFNLSRNTYATGDNCLVFEESHNAASTDVDINGEVGDEHNVAVSTADLALANITHTVAGNVITLSWTAIDGIDEMDILVFDPDDAAWKNIAKNVKMSAEKFDYTMTRDKEHIFRFVPLNGAKEIDYNVNAMRSEAMPEPVIANPPKTGPVENTLLIIALSGLIYMGYRRYTARKA
jgi:hypothetical protein